MNELVGQGRQGSPDAAHRWAMIVALSAVFPLAHAVGVFASADLAKPLSYGFLLAAPALAAAACFWRARASEVRVHWTALGAAMLLWAGGMAAVMAGEMLAGFDDDGAIGLLLFVLYGVPLIFVAASPARDGWWVRLVDAGLALVLGLVFFAHTFTFATLEGIEGGGFQNLRLMFDVENAFIALFAAVRLRAARARAEQAFFSTLAVYAIAYMLVAAYINHFQSDTGYGSPWDLLVPLPFLLLTALALLARNGWPAAASDRLVSAVAAGSPIMLPTALLAVSASLVVHRPAIGIAGFAAALFGYGLRTVLVQVHGHDERAALTALALTDALTGLANRRLFDEALASEWSRARRGDASLALLMVDIDRFKQLNDTLGHPAGDRCLREVGRTLAGCVKRKGDVVARYGGEEFAIVLPNTSREDALRVAEWMRKKIARKGLRASGAGGTVTVSIGVGCVDGPHGDDATLLIAAADSALYEAKRSGRNRVVARWLDESPASRLSSSA